MRSIRSAVRGPELPSYDAARAELGGEPWKPAPNTESWFLPSPTGAVRALEMASPLDEPAVVYTDSFAVKSGWTTGQRLILTIAVALVLVGAGIVTRTRGSDLGRRRGTLELLVHSSSTGETARIGPTALSIFAPTVGEKPGPLKLARANMAPSVRALFDRGGRSPEPRKRSGKSKSGRSRRHSVASKHRVRSPV